MAIRLDEIEREGRGVGGWRTPAQRAFVRSSAYGVLHRALDRYVQGQTAGRAFLIGGHRGAGKTALVEQVVEDLRWDSIEAVAAGIYSAEPRHRPLLVKLHGPSLFLPEAPSQTTPQADTGKPESNAHQALIQITLALYRAVAEEVSWGAALHARSAHPTEQRRQMELASQLRLELDAAPDPATVRLLWARAGRLKGGVLWPDPPKDAAGLGADQGLREVVAVATVAEAFRRCAGRNEEARKLDLNVSQESQVASKLGAELKDVVNKVLAVGVGLGAGGVLQAHSVAPGGVLVGALAAGVLSGLSFSWADARARTLKQSVSYTFIRDTDVATLDRELPLAIRRVKAAGLTPVFVVDELDKLDGAADKVRDLLSKLKHLVTDFGFFCFLADRSCYDRLRGVSELSAYPAEHTYFSDRLYVAYGPSSLVDYLQAITQYVDRPGAIEPPGDYTSRLTLALETVLRARPHFIDVMRRITRLADKNGLLRIDADLKTPARLLAAAFQLGVLHVLEDEAVAARLQADGAFMQPLVDSLYWPVCLWEQQAETVELDAQNLRDHLLVRAGCPAGAPLTDIGLSEETLTFLLERVARLLDALGDFRALGREFGGMGAALPSFTDALVVRESPGRYRFFYDAHGRQLSVPTAPGAPRADQESLTLRISTALDFHHAVQLVLRYLSLPLDFLVQLQLLPSDLSARVLGKAAAALRRALQDDAAEERTEEALTALEALRVALARHGERLGRMLLAAGQVNALAGRRRQDLRRTLEVLVRLGVRDVFAIPEVPQPPQQPGPLWDAADRLHAWIGEVQQWMHAWGRASLQFSEDRNPAHLWSTWRERVQRALGDSSSPTPPLSFEHVLNAVRGQSPGRFFRGDLGQMTVGDWSTLALSYFDPPSDDHPHPTPLWAFAAGLIALNAPAEIVTDALDSIHRVPGGHPRLFTETELALARRFELLEQQPGPGSVLLINANSGTRNWRPEPGAFIMTVLKSDYPRYDGVIDWLTELNAFGNLGTEA